MHNHRFSNKKILEKSNKKVFGHERAKKVIINAFNRARLRAHQLYTTKQTEKEQNVLENKHVLLIAPSGTGKTILVREIAELCDMAFIEIDASQIQLTGCVGGLQVKDIKKLITTKCDDLYEYLSDLYSYEEIRGHCIVFLDEFDKLAGHYDGTSNGKWNSSTQSNLLKMLEGTEDGFEGVTFILAGAFTGIKSYQTKKHMGFVEAAKQHAKAQHNLEQAVVDYGVLPELVGRISSIVQLDELTKDNYIDILKRYIIPKARKDMKHYGRTNFKLYKEDIDGMVKEAMKSGQGVRTLKKQVQDRLEELEFDYEEIVDRGAGK